MRLSILAIGKLRKGPEASLVDDYAERASKLSRNLGFTGPAVQEYEPPRGLSGRPRTTKEGEWLLHAAGDAKIIALDETGESLSSVAFADQLQKFRDAGASGAAFVIGGADGHDPALVAAAQRTISFGKATWPHMLVRAMLAEQLYRAMTILSGHPYHRA